MNQCHHQWTGKEITKLGTLQFTSCEVTLGVIRKEQVYVVSK